MVMYEGGFKEKKEKKERKDPWVLNWGRGFERSSVVGLG